MFTSEVNFLKDYLRSCEDFLGYITGEDCSEMGIEIELKFDSIYVREYISKLVLKSDRGVIKEYSTTEDFIGLVDEFLLLAPWRTFSHAGHDFNIEITEEVREFMKFLKIAFRYFLRRPDNPKYIVSDEYELTGCEGGIFLIFDKRERNYSVISSRDDEYGWNISEEVVCYAGRLKDVVRENCPGAKIEGFYYN